MKHFLLFSGSFCAVIVISIFAGAPRAEAYSYAVDSVYPSYDNCYYGNGSNCYNYAYHSYGPYYQPYSSAYSYSYGQQYSNYGYVRPVRRRPYITRYQPYNSYNYNYTYSNSYGHPYDYRYRPSVYNNGYYGNSYYGNSYVNGYYW